MPEYRKHVRFFLSEISKDKPPRHLANGWPQPDNIPIPECCPDFVTDEVVGEPYMQAETASDQGEGLGADEKLPHDGGREEPDAEELMPLDTGGLTLDEEIDFFGLDEEPTPQEQHSRVGHLAMGPTRTEPAPSRGTGDNSPPTPNIDVSGPTSTMLVTQPDITPASSSGSAVDANKQAGPAGEPYDIAPLIPLREGSGLKRHNTPTSPDEELATPADGSGNTGPEHPPNDHQWDGEDDNCRYCNSFLLAGGGGDCLNPACMYNQPLFPSTRLEWLAANRICAEPA